MKQKTKLIAAVFLSFAVFLGAFPAATRALPPATYTPGSESAIFGHTFSEHYWTSEQTFEHENGSVEIITSYVNYQQTGAFHAALLALGDVYENNTDTNSTIPYQLFAMHFTTPENKELFIGAVFAFLYAFNDTNLNNVPDGAEDRWLLVPFGWDGGNRTATPSVDAIEVTNPQEGQYRFGVTYNDLYCRVVVGGDNWITFLATLAAPFIEIQISELTFEYVINVNSTSGEITAETFYTIGEVDSLYVLGTEIPDIDIHTLLENVTIGAAHFIVAFGSNYYVEEGTTTPTNATNWVESGIFTDQAGRERAFAVGVRGTYDLINESTMTPIAEDQVAIAWVMQPMLSDLLLVYWQFPFSADFLAIFAYAVSPALQTIYDGPLDVYNHADTAFNKRAFWYAISFPRFGGYRVEHDPVYTAYSNIGQVAPPIPGFPLEAVLVGLVASVLVVVVVRRRRKP